MNTGQTMFTLIALTVLSIITLRYYSSVANNGRTLVQSKAGLTATTIATSYIERAQNMSFDSATVGFSVDTIKQDPTLLTGPDALGREAGEDSLNLFNDFDDFNGYEENFVLPDGTETYKVKFAVYYVDPDNIEVKSTVRTFIKQMDISVWRIYPPLDMTQATIFDTARTSTIMGYFKFN
jgi:hypothetical protein